MNPGDVVLSPLPDSTGTLKVRPAVVLSILPGPYGDVLICGISTQLTQEVSGWDELIQPGDVDFPSSGLHRASLIRLSFLHAEYPGHIKNAIGLIDPARLERLLTRLADQIHP